ncbi:MAG: DUF4469 domain-containing protein [Bacteroidales bacterium]|jgi:hypothetical protein|nr:DUF4469 domain-containing protein [Bacteroidales bacterium]
MSNYHKIKAHLYNNALTENPNDFMAKVNSERTLGIADLCASAVARGGADMPALAIEHASRLLFREMAYNLCDGFSFNADGWFSASPRIRGVFDSPTEQFDPAKHTLLFDFHQGALLRRELEQVEVEIMGVADTLLFVAQVTDVKTGSVNDLLTPGRNLRITGSRLKVAGDNPSCGVYFARQNTQEHIRVDNSDMVVNNPSELLIVIPELPAGAYNVSIITQYGGHSKNMLREPRNFLFDKILTVR